MTPGEAAADYLARGWSCIPIYGAADGHCACGADPCPKGAGKHPATLFGQWDTYTKQLPAPELAESWFSAPEPRNIAIICGQVSGGLIVLDCDDETTYRSVLYLYPELGRTLTVQTGKGFHIYMHALEPVKTVTFTVNGVKNHLKGDHSYVVAPPSVHVSGRQYKWIDDQLLTVDLARLRATLKRLGAKQASEEPKVGTDPEGWAKLILEGARFGERDDQAIRLAGLMRHHNLPIAVAMALMELWATRCDSTPADPWGPAQVRGKVLSAYHYAPGSA